MRYLERYAFQFIPDITKIVDFSLSDTITRIERDKYWDPKGSLEIYTKSAQSARGIYV